MKYKELDELAKRYNIRTSKDRGCIEYISENRSFRIKISEINKKIKIVNYEGYFFDLGTPDFEFMKKAIELAETPIAEREEEKKYYLKHKWVNGYNNDYLAYIISQNMYSLVNPNVWSDVRTQFTLKEINEIKKMFDTDLSDFKLLEVEE